MGSFKRALFGYRRPDVDSAVSSRDAEIESLRKGVSDLEGETVSLSGMVLEREREIHDLDQRLREAERRHGDSIDSLRAIAERLEEVQAQARGQATRIRMKALSEAVEVSRRVQALSEATGESVDVDSDELEIDPEPLADGLFEGDLQVEIGPLGDFSQLVGFEDAVGRIGASEISVERFSEGRATLSMHLEEPTELLRELEELSVLDFKVRRTAPDNLILDVDEDSGPEQHAA